MESASEPIYIQIRRILEQEIRNHLKPGDKLDSENRLAERFNVNRHTLRRAVETLVHEGMIERRRGVGLFVMERPFDYPLDASTRLSANLASMGTQGRRESIRRFTAPASEPIAEQLEIKTGTLVMCLEYLVVVKGISFNISSHYFDHKAFRQIYDKFDNTGSLHAFIKNAYGISLRRRSSVISAGMPDDDEASLLRVPRTLPVIIVRSVNVDTEAKKPVEYVRTRFRSDRVEFSVKF